MFRISWTMRLDRELIFIKLNVIPARTSPRRHGAWSSEVWEGRQLSPVPWFGLTVQHLAEKGGVGASGGRARGGRTTKIHCLADGCGRLVAIELTPGNIADISMAQPLLEALAPAKRLVADKAYDADRLRQWLADRSIVSVIPARATRVSVYAVNKAAYRRRNIIERMIGRLKNRKRIATRYDRLAVNFMAAITLVALAAQWLR